MFQLMKILKMSREHAFPSRKKKASPHLDIEEPKEVYYLGGAALLCVYDAGCTWVGFATFFPSFRLLLFAAAAPSWISFRVVKVQSTLYHVT